MFAKQGLSTAALGALLVCLTPLAAAQVVAHGDVRQFSYQLVDLAPADGVAPSITITPDSVLGQVELRDNAVGSGDPATFAEITANGSINVHNHDGNATLAAAADAASASISLAANSGDVFSMSNFKFVLSAHTRVIFTVAASVNASAAPGGDAFAEAGLFSVPDSTDGVTTALDAYLSTAGGQQARPLSVVVDAQDQPLTGIVSLLGYGQVHAPPAAGTIRGKK